MPDMTASYGAPLDFNEFLGNFTNNNWRLIMSAVL